YGEKFKKSMEAHLPAIGSQIDLLYRNFDNPNLISVDWTNPGYKIYLQHLMDQLHPKEERDCLATLTSGDSRYKAWLALFCDHITNTKE
ncbi:MAG: hypothetical protein K2X98_05545, partial [Alphaproteobacteria bacterium]|nr:hypothetical protein [Alphaproteobacteria bacterium]